MDRVEAIEILAGRYLITVDEVSKTAKDHTRRVNEALDLAIEALGVAESATTTDCISRADTIKAMCAKCGLEHSCGDCYENSCPDVKVVMDMPSVSGEEVDYCNNCPYISWGEDCISRQQAESIICRLICQRLTVNKPLIR